MASVNNTSSSTSAFSYLQYKNKIGGLVSGMDIDSIMEKLMKAENAQKEKLMQQKQKYEWKRDAYREVNTSLNTTYNKLFDDFGLQSKWTSKTVNTSSSKVSVTASSTASGNLSIQSATAAKAATSSFSTASTTAFTEKRIDETTRISEIQGASLAGTLKLSVEGKEDVYEISINADDTVQQVLDKINNIKTIGADNQEKSVFNATVKDGALSISSSVGKITAADETSKSTLRSIGMISESTASGTVLKTQDAENNDVKATASTKLVDLGMPESGTLEFKVGDKTKTITYTAEDDTLEKLFAKINVKSTGDQDPQLKASISGGKISITSTAGTVTMTDSDEKTKLGFDNYSLKSSDRLFRASTSGETNEIVGTTVLRELGLTDAGSFKISSIQADGSMKDTEIKYKSTDTINTLLSSINSSGAGVTAIYNNGQLSIVSNNTGSADKGTADTKAEVSLITTKRNSDDTADVENTDVLSLFSKLGVDTANMKDGNVVLADGGTSASLTVNGVTYDSTSNNFNVAGYSITLNDDITSADKVTVSSTNNADAAVDKVKSFVEMYNSLIESLNVKTSEKKNVSYEPLTDAQKAEMTTDEITKWEEKAKAGLLKGDSSINSLISQMRQTLYKGTGANTLYNIGISTSSTWSDNGKLVIDEDKLRAALEKDPDVLAKTFVGTADEPGIVNNLRTELKSTINKIEASAGKASMVDKQYSLGKTILSLTEKISSWEDRLKDIEERYWNQFSAMETAIQKANSQSSIFMQ